MIRGYVDRMLRPRDLVLQFHRTGDADADGGGVTGILLTSQRLRAGDLDRVRQIDPRNLVDGQILKIKR